jgi:hypothetical protein
MRWEVRLPARSVCSHELGTDTPTKVSFDSPFVLMLLQIAQGCVFALIKNPRSLFALFCKKSAKMGPFLFTPLRTLQKKVLSTTLLQSAVSALFCKTPGVAPLKSKSNRL